MCGKVERFEDLVAWQKARALVAEVYRVTSEGAFARDFHLKDQIRDAAVSIMSNTAEGFERGRMSEFHQFLSIAKGSCGELRSQLYVALDATYISEGTFRRLMNEAQEVGRLIGGLRASVERKRDDCARRGSASHARPATD
ncbi:MAG TPA: four helix bundle protein [Phycisphaerae bacterium]|jgi:four helix bundle protein|nr:four helix bundle protein [Phycisphaerae bacterium]HOB75607.1 four helix bundle protein [Phycisphaerae bacterium]HOJ56356.1 four helix bundle protein [Phycisphaerae bacterium]HOL28153.1 four helix bundle protein [Phycisphaerae bacterium]HPP22592.1 four helix bundle protein [Phycisphaerae bacterium]